MNDTYGRSVLRKAQAAQFIPATSWDVESMLSRAVANVLGTLPPEQNQAHNVDKPVRIRPSSRITMTDSSLQMRLLAEQICKKVELRYEQRTRDMRERDRTETERRLAEIREEYEKEREMMLSTMERDKRRYEDALRDRERNIRHQIDMRIGERESKLEEDRRSLENRLQEFLINKEQFERMKHEYKSKIDSEMERIHIEKERVVRKEASLTHSEKRARLVASAFLEVEKNEQNERIRTLELRITELTRKLADAGSQNFELRQNLDTKTGVENELLACKENCRRILTESREMTEKLRKMSNYEDIQEENRLLKRELNDLRSTHQSCLVSPGERVKAEREERDRRLAEESAQLKIRELRLALTMMNDRVRTLTSERGYLLGELKLLRKDRLKRTISDHRMRGSERAFGVQKYRTARMDSVDSDSSVSISSGISEGDSDIRQIRKRIRGLDQMARDLDQCAEQFTNYRSVSADRAIEQEISRGTESRRDADNLDEYCRSRASHRHSRHELNTSETQSPQKEKGSRIERQEHERMIRRPFEVENIVEPPILRSKASRSLQFDSTSKSGRISNTTSQMVKEANVKPIMPEPREDNGRINNADIIEENKNTDDKAQSGRVLTAEEEFAERLRQRTAQRRSHEKSLTLENHSSTTTNIDQSEPIRNEESQPEPSTSIVNPDGVHPEMLRYMALIQKERQQQSQEKPASPPRVVQRPVERIPSDDSIKVPDLTLDKPEVSDDDFGW